MAYCLINKSNYFYNLSQIENRIDKDKIAVVIKNNAYGHGILEIAKLCPRLIASISAWAKTEFFSIVLF